MAPDPPLYSSVSECPKGPWPGPLLFLEYIQSLHALISVHHHGYADDQQVYNHFTMRDTASYSQSLHELEVCVDDIRDWMLKNRLMLNSDKTEYTVITTQSYNATSPHEAPVPLGWVGGVTVPNSLTLRNLGSTMDCTRTMGCTH